MGQPCEFQAMEAVPGFGPRAYTDKAYGVFREALVSI
jgi:hypothetical protein